MKQQIIRFFQIVDENRAPFPNAFPFEELQDVIVSLEDDQAYVRLNRMELLGSAYKPVRGPGAQRRVPLIALDRITRNPQMRIERSREYRPLVLGEDENLADPAFYSVFDSGVIGILRASSLAPGSASFRDYVNSLSIVKPPISIIPLVDTNAIRALDKIGTLTKFDIRVLPDAGPRVFTQSPLIYDAIKSARESLGSVAVEVTVSIAAKGQYEAAESARTQVANIVTTDAIGYADKAQIRYRSIEDGKATTHDFLNEALTMTVGVEMDDATGQPIESSVAEAMATAYDEMYEDIHSALRALD